MLERLLERTEFSARVSLVYCVEGTAEGKRPRSSYAESLVLDLLMDGKALPLKEVYRRGKEHTVRYLDDIGEPVTRPLPIGKETLRSAWRRYGFTAGRAGFGGEFWLYPPGLQPKGSRGGG